MGHDLVALVSGFEKDVKTFDKVLNQGKEPDDIIKNFYDGGDCLEQDIIEDWTKYAGRQLYIDIVKKELDEIYQKYNKMLFALEETRAHFFGEL